MLTVWSVISLNTSFANTEKLSERGFSKGLTYSTVKN